MNPDDGDDRRSPRPPSDKEKQPAKKKQRMAEQKGRRPLFGGDHSPHPLQPSEPLPEVDISLPMSPLAAPAPLPTSVEPVAPAYEVWLRQDEPRAEDPPRIREVTRWHQAWLDELTYKGKLLMQWRERERLPGWQMANRWQTRFNETAKPGTLEALARRTSQALDRYVAEGAVIGAQRQAASERSRRISSQPKAPPTTKSAGGMPGASTSRNVDTSNLDITKRGTVRRGEQGINYPRWNKNDAEGLIDLPHLDFFSLAELSKKMRKVAMTEYGRRLAAGEYVERPPLYPSEYYFDLSNDHLRQLMKPHIGIEMAVRLGKERLIGMLQYIDAKKGHRSADGSQRSISISWLAPRRPTRASTPGRHAELCYSEQR